MEGRVRERLFVQEGWTRACGLWRLLEQLQCMRPWKLGAMQSERGNVCLCKVHRAAAAARQRAAARGAPRAP